VVLGSAFTAAGQKRVEEPRLMAGPEVKLLPGRPAAWSLEIFKSGGMLGSTTATLLRSAGTQGFSSIRERANSRPQLPRASLIEIEDAIRAAKPSRWLASYVQPMSACCDRTLITVTLEICDADNHWLAYSAEWYLGDPIPKDLLKIYRAAISDDSSVPPFDPEKRSRRGVGLRYAYFGRRNL
jgi:hypothetical protein